MPYTTSWPKHTYEPTPLPLSMPDKPDAEVLKERVLDDALGASIWQSFQQTFGYRWRGEDTLDWGDPGNWIQIKWIRCLVQSPPVEGFINTRLIQYDALREILESSRLRQIEEIYSLRDPATAWRFLHTHPQLIEVLLEAHVYLQKYFGPDPQVALAVVSDPEVEGMEELFAYILTPLPVDEALARLNRLDEEWFLDQLNRVGGRFNFNLEFL